MKSSVYVDWRRSGLCKLSTDPVQNGFPLHLRSLEQNLSARPKLLVPPWDLTQQLRKMKLHRFFFLVQFCCLLVITVVAHEDNNSFDLTAEIVTHYEEQIWDLHQFNSYVPALLLNYISFLGSSVDILYTFASCSGLHLIFGLNALLRTADLQWNSSNAQLLLDYCSSQIYNISWELGNGKYHWAHLFMRFPFGIICFYLWHSF